MSDTVEGAEVAPVENPPSPAPVEAPENLIDAILTAWVNDCIHNSPASRDTDCYNHIVTNALPELRARLLKGS